MKRQVHRCTYLSIGLPGRPGKWSDMPTVCTCQSVCLARAPKLVEYVCTGMLGTPSTQREARKPVFCLVQSTGGISSRRRVCHYRTGERSNDESSMSPKLHVCPLDVRQAESLAKTQEHVIDSEEATGRIYRTKKAIDNADSSTSICL